MSDRYTIFAGETQPSAGQQLLDGQGEPLDLTGASVKFRGRLSGADPDVLLIDTDAVVEGDPTLGNVRYDWQAGDTATPGELIAWWFVTIASNSQSTPAFVIPIIDQAAVDPGSGIYASVLDVKSLAGFLSDAWTPTSETDDADIEGFLAMTSGELDAILLSRGAMLPLDPTGAVAVALRGLTADGALVRALGATWPSDAPEGVAELRKDARTRYVAGLAALAAGTHPAALALASTTVASSASTFALDDPSYGRWRWGGHWDTEDYSPSLAPTIHKGQGF